MFGVTIIRNCPKPTRVVVSTNKLLEHITEKLAHTAPCWEKIVERFKTTPEFRAKKYRQDNDCSNLASLLSETYLRITLEDICKTFKNSVVFDKIKGGEETENYRFEYLNGLVAIRKNNNQQHSQMDELLVVDNLPVLFEIKLTYYKGRNSSGGTKQQLSHHGKRRINSRTRVSPSDRGIPYAMKPKRINYLLHPLVEYFDTFNLGYILVISSDQIKPTSPVQQKFKEIGGILVPFYTDRKRYREEVVEIKHAYDI